MSTFLNPYTDYGFKKIFGEEASKPQLMDFLNSLLPEYHQIKELNFRNTEQLGANDNSRKAVYDIYCESTTGERFIVEMQKVGHKYFKERTVYYSTFPIQEQAEKGNWDYFLSAVYCIGIVDFMINNDDEKRDVIHTIKLKDQHNQIFYDKLTFIYLEMPSFKKIESQLTTRLDKWLFFIKHLEDFEQIPAIFNDDIFIQAFDTARIASLTGSDYDSYQASLKALRDNYATWKSGIEDAREEGREEGIEIGEVNKALAIAKSLKQAGMPIEFIIEHTGLTKVEIENI